MYNNEKSKKVPKEVKETKIDLEHKKEEARKQLEKYSMDERINTENLRKYIVVFALNDVKLLESV